MEDPRIIAAVIAGIVSISGSLLAAGITLFSLHKRMKSQDAQLEIKKQEIEHIQKELMIEIERLRQTQLSQVLAKRLESYPKLWAVHIQYETNWELENKLKTGEWALQYLDALNQFNIESGLFISQDLYSMFAKLRNLLYKISESTGVGEIVDSDLALEVRLLVYGSDGRPGLSTYLKDDLGSYRNVYLQRRGNDKA